MALLFDHLIDIFTLDDATLYSATATDLEDGGEFIPTRPVVEFASLHDDLRHLKEDWTCVPLHDEDSATLSGSFLAFTMHSIHGPIFIFEREGERPDGRFSGTTRELLSRERRRLITLPALC